MSNEGYEKEVSIMAEYFQDLNEKASNIIPSDHKGKYFFFNFL